MRLKLSELAGIIAVFVWLVVNSVFSADFSGYNYKMPITFSGYDKSETLTNFPVLVIFNSDVIPGFTYAQFGSANDADLRFTDSTEANELNYEIEKWDTAGTSYVWVQVSSIANSSDKIYAFWGTNGATVPAYTTNGDSWSNGCVGVWHLGDADANGNLPDSGADDNVATNFGTVDIAGRIGNAQDFEYESHTYLKVANESNFDFSPDITVSAWVKGGVVQNPVLVGGGNRKQG